MSFFLTPPQNPVTFRQLNGVLSNADIAQVLTYVATQKIDDGVLGGGRIDKEVRRSKIAFLQPTAEIKWLYNKLATTIREVNRRDFNFELDALQPIQYTEYHSTDNGTYDDHLDWAANVIRPRKLSISIQLTDDTDYEGGDLHIKMTSNHPYIASRTKGDALVFPSFLLHGVTPVSRGVRKSLVAWVTGPEWK